jgi:H+/Cl- antiporter ClcA
LGRWGFLLVASCLALGGAAAAFLAGLRWVGATFAAHPWLLWTLPAIWFLTLWALKRVGPRCAGGTKTLIAEIKDPQETLPASMPPMIVGFTLLSHLGGASVGREGTALQMGGSLVDQFSRVFTLSKEERRTLLLCGVSGGFAAVFGTPLAAAVFALEFVRRAEFGRFALCLLTAFGADWAGQHLFGATHANYRFAEAVALTPGWLFSAGCLGLAFGLVGWFFVRTVDSGNSLTAKAKRPWVPYATIVVLSLAFAAITSRHLEATGLSLGLIDSALLQTVASDAFAWKFILTALCLIAGFRGGEVTPLFVMGATLGAALSGFTNLPIAVAPALGLVTVFAAAGAVPLTGLCLALELFGPSLAPYAAACGLTAWLVARGLGKLGSGRNSLYAE